MAFSDTDKQRLSFDLISSLLSLAKGNAMSKSALCLSVLMGFTAFSRAHLATALAYCSPSNIVRRAL